MQLWTGGWVKQMVKMDEAVGDKNRLGKLRGDKHSVSHFTNN